MSKDHLKKIWTGPETGDPKPILYLSGSGGPVLLFRKPEIQNLLKYYCLSYFNLSSGSPKNCYVRALSVFQQKGVRCFLDSGAYSYQMQALKKKKPLSMKDAERVIDGYVDWVYATKFIFDFIVTFDYLRDPKVVLWATQRIEARGLHPIPVYHQGVSISALRDLVDRGYTLIGISCSDPRIYSRTQPFLDQVFNITEKYGVRCHGLGSGGRELISYPWFSVDSTTWLQGAQLGFIHQFSRDSRHLYVSIPHSTRQTLVVNKVDGVEDTYASRAVYNIQFWIQLMERLNQNNQKQQRRKKSLF